MKTYEITYSNGNDIYSANLVIAESAEQATAYYTAKGREVIGCDETMSRPKPGQPIVTVPEGWTAPAVETETTETTEQTTETAQDAERDNRIADITKQRTDALMIKLMREIINAHNAREGWDRGVKIYACELLDSLAERVEWAHRSGEPSPLESRETVRAALLNGAKDWYQYSYGGCSLIYDGDIAARICTPHRLNLHDGGNKPPIGGSEWLDQQAVALNQASAKVLAAYNRVVAARYERGARI